MGSEEKSDVYLTMISNRFAINTYYPAYYPANDDVVIYWN